MSLFGAERGAGCTVAQIIGERFSAGESKLKVTPGWKARREPVFLSALHLKLQTLYSSTVPQAGASLNGGAESFWQTQSLIPPPGFSINLSYPELNMSRVDVTPCLCWGQTEEEWKGGGGG